MKNSWLEAFIEGWPLIATSALLSIAITYPLAHGSDNISEIGDWVGGIASAVAFLWLVAGYNIQRRELSLQRDELQLQRKALQQQVQEMHEATKVSRENARATLRAAEATEKTIEQTRASTEAAVKGANAAELSAKAAIGMELPNLHVMEITAKGPTEKWLGSSDFLPVITIKNFGRTTAFITDILVNLKIGTLPEKRKYKSLIGIPNPYVLEPKESFDYKELFLDMQFKLTQEDIKTILAEKEYLCLYGVIKFKDFMDNLHETGFAYFWSEGNKIFLLDSSEQYNFKT